MSNFLSRFVAGDSHLAIEHPPSSSKENPALPTPGTSSATTSSQQIENNQDVRIQASQAFHFHGCILLHALNNKCEIELIDCYFSIDFRAKIGTEFPFDRLS